MTLQMPPALELLHQQAADLAQAGNYIQAISLYEAWLEQEPSCRTAYWQLGLMHLLMGQEAEAQLTWMMALSEASEDVEDWTIELLTFLEQTAEVKAAEQQFELAWLIRQHIREINPSDINNLLYIVRLSLQLERFTPNELDETGLILQLQAESDSVDRLLLWNVLQQVLELIPEHSLAIKFTEACSFYAESPADLIDILIPVCVRLMVKLLNSSAACHYAELCYRLDPNHLDTLFRLSLAYQNLERFEEGIAIARQYYDRCQTPFEKAIANSIILRGYMSAGSNWQEAAVLLDRQTALLDRWLDETTPQPDPLIDSSILAAPIFFYPYFSDDLAKNRTIQNRVAEFFQVSLQAHTAKHIDDYQPYPQAPFIRTDRPKLRIGWLSRSMRRHSVGWLSRWLFKYYDRERFEFYAYFNQQARLDPFARYWFADQATCGCMFDGDILGVAKNIREDAVDILVDLDSLTADMNCGAMALKPAPVQVSWLGLDAPGLPAIDYFIADRYVLPDDAQAYYNERIWRLPQTYIAVDGFEIGVPTLRRDQLGIPVDAVTFLSSQYAYKRHPQTMRLQMQVIKQVPNSYFLIKGEGDEAGIRKAFEQVAEEVGVSVDRLRYLPRDPSEEIHRANLGIADVVLDTFPYNGATTTLETLWMGIPIVTKVGRQFAARNSYGMMMNAGITEGIAWTDEEYIEWGVRLGTDAALRQQIAWRLHQSRQTAPLWNAQQFTREMEKAFEQMWAIYQG